MFALKSARDQLNSPDKLRLLLVFSGSDRDKLFRPWRPPKIPHLWPLENPPPLR